jgi:hypothetical protein
MDLLQMFETRAGGGRSGANRSAGSDSVAHAVRGVGRHSAPGAHGGRAGVPAGGTRCRRRGDSGVAIRRGDRCGSVPIARARRVGAPRQSHRDDGSRSPTDRHMGLTGAAQREGARWARGLSTDVDAVTENGLTARSRRSLPTHSIGRTRPSGAGTSRRFRGSPSRQCTRDRESTSSHGSSAGRRAPGVSVW